MRTRFNGILAAVGVAALLGSPAAAKPHHHHAPSAVPGDARGAAIRDLPYGLPGGPGEGGPYTPNIPTPAHGPNRDFQDGSRG